MNDASRQGPSHEVNSSKVTPARRASAHPSGRVLRHANERPRPNGYFLDKIRALVPLPRRSRAGACERSRASGLGKGYGFAPFAFMPWHNTRAGASSSKARRSHRGCPRPPACIWCSRVKKRRPVPRPLVILKAAALSCGASCSRDVEGAPRAAAPDDEYEAPARRRLAPEGEQWRRRAAPPCLCAERQRLLESDLSRDYLSRVCSLALAYRVSTICYVSDRHSDAQFWPNSKRKNDT